MTVFPVAVVPPPTGAETWIVGALVYPRPPSTIVNPDTWPEPLIVAVRDAARGSGIELSTTNPPIGLVGRSPS